MCLTIRMADAPAPAGGRGRGGFGGRGRGGRGGQRGRGRGGQRGRGRGKEETEWVPVTKLGRLVRDGKIKSLEEIYLFSLPIKVKLLLKIDEMPQKDSLTPFSLIIVGI